MTTKADIALWHIPNRLWFAADQAVPLAEFWTFMPMQCTWCKRKSKNVSHFRVSVQGHILCLDKKSCYKAAGTTPEGRKRRVEAPETPAEASDGQPKPKRCREVYDDDPANRCRGPQGHNGRHKDKAGHRWSTEG